MKVYILEKWTFAYGGRRSDILGVYSSLENAREFINNAGYRYEDSFLQMRSEYLETYSKEEYKTISIIERELNKDYSILRADGDYFWRD